MPAIEPQTLEVFDFDWTLFRSPLPPRGYSENQWWDSEESLLPPHVPLRPDDKYWIAEVVRELKAAQRRRGSFTAIITGRRAPTRERIWRLLQQQRLNPDVAVCRNASIRKDKDLTYFKRGVILDILDENPSIKKIVLWEDREEQLKDTKHLAKHRKLEFEGHHITEGEGNTP